MSTFIAKTSNLRTIIIVKKITIFLTLAAVLIGGSGYAIYQANPTVKKKQFVAKYNAKSLAEKCRGDLLDGEAKSTGARGCYLEYFTNVFDLEGPKIAVDTLIKYAEDSSGLSGECHSVGHLLGQYAFKTAGDNAYNADLTACAFSYGHGILQAASKVTPKEELKQKFFGLCEFTIDKSGCLHGFGHTLRDLDFDVSESLSYCNQEGKLAGTNEYDTIENREQTCMEGWAMEDFTLRNLFWITVTQPNIVAKLCDGIEGAGWVGCTGSAFRNYVVAPDPIHDEDYLAKRDERLVWFKNYCMTQENANLIRRCMNYVGLTFAEVYTLEMDNKITAPKAEQFCSGKDLDMCFSSLINSRWNRMGNSQEKVYPLCDAMILEKNKAICRDIVSKQKIGI